VIASAEELPDVTRSSVWLPQAARVRTRDVETAMTARNRFTPGA